MKGVGLHARPLLCLLKSCLTSSKAQEVFVLNLHHGKTAKDALCRGEVYPGRKAKARPVEQVQRQAVVKGHSRPHRKRFEGVNFSRLPETLWPHLGKLSGLQVGILADVWTWQEQGKTARRSNESIGQLFGVTSRAVTKAVKRLEELGLVEVSYGEKNLRHIKALTPETLNKCSPRTNVHPEQSFTPTMNERSPLPRTIVHPTPEQSFTQIEHRIEHTEEQRVEQEAKPKKEARPKSVEDVVAAFVEAGSTEDEAHKYFDHYESKGWKVGSVAMKDWKAAARNWLRNEKKYGPQNNWRDRSSRQLDTAKALEWANGKR